MKDNLPKTTETFQQLVDAALSPKEQLDIKSKANENKNIPKWQFILASVIYAIWQAI